MSNLYDSDFLRWTEQQTELLRRRAAGQLASDVCPWSLDQILSIDFLPD